MSKQPTLQKRADIVVIGGGPATLGLLCNAAKTNRLHELVTTGDGLAVLESGLCFGGGDLQEYGINSNTSANGFLKCTYKKRETTQSPAKASPKKSPAKKVSSESEDESDGELAEDSERDEDGPARQFEWVALNSHRDLYQCTPIYKLMAEFG